MQKIGLRELKNRLGHYVRRVGAGHEIQVTDRGEVTLGGPNDPKLYRRMPRLLKRGELQRLLDEERGER